MEKSRVAQLSNVYTLPERTDPNLTPWRIDGSAEVIYLPEISSSQEQFEEALDCEKASLAFFDKIEPKIKHLGYDNSEDAMGVQINIAEIFNDHAATHGIREAVEYTRKIIDSMSRHPTTRHLFDTTDQSPHI